VQIEAEVRRSLFPTLWCCRAVLPAMLERKRSAILFLASDEASYITGTVLPVGGGDQGCVKLD